MYDLFLDGVPSSLTCYQNKRKKNKISPLDMIHVPYLPHLPTLTFFGKLIELGVLCAQVCTW